MSGYGEPSRAQKTITPSLLADHPRGKQLAAIAEGHHHHHHQHGRSGSQLLSSLPEDVQCRITGFLDAPSLVRMRAVNRYYRRLASEDPAGWAFLCEYLWRDKIHVGVQAREEPNRLEAYRLSIEDAIQRQHLTLEELCYNPSTDTGTIWSFRFKEAAGSDWTSADPWFNGRPPRKLVFLADGTVKQYVEQGADGAALESPTFGRSPSVQQHLDWHEPGHLADLPMPMTWRFLVRPMDFPTRPLGSYVRFSVGGRDVPTYAVRRSPTGNWGFVMESCWGLYASFELPPRQRRQRRRLRRTEEGGALWVDEEVGEEDEPINELQDDAALLITNEIQWREAFLYNVGARVLPEGDEATDEFDRAWGGLN